MTLSKGTYTTCGGHVFPRSPPPAGILSDGCPELKSVEVVCIVCGRRRREKRRFNFDRGISVMIAEITFVALYLLAAVIIPSFRIAPASNSESDKDNTRHLVFHLSNHLHRWWWSSDCSRLPHTRHSMLVLNTAAPAATYVHLHTQTNQSSATKKRPCRHEGVTRERVRGPSTPARILTLLLPHEKTVRRSSVNEKANFATPAALSKQHLRPSRTCRELAPNTPLPKINTRPPPLPVSHL